MPIKAVFDDIQNTIAIELERASHSIEVAVAWFTDYDLINILTTKARQGVRVSVVISNIVLNNKPQAAFKNLVEAGGSVFLAGDETQLMHHKFCVVDYRTAITGSYNWSNQAHGNFENVVVITDYETAIEYTKCYDRLLAEPSVSKLELNDTTDNPPKLVVAKAEAMRDLGLEVDLAAIAALL